MRPVLAKILSAATRAAGVQVSLGVTFTAMAADAEGASVDFSDGRRGRYDLVIGADGLFSKVRTEVFPEAPTPAYTGQGVWRAVFDRPVGIDTTMMWVGPRVKVGINPVSKSQVYMFVTEDQPTKRRVDPRDYVSAVQELLKPFTAAEVIHLRQTVGPDSQIVYRPLEALLLPRPWHKGRLVLIGDAVHATTPHLASGAGIGLEDAIVLAEELATAADVESGLVAFESRRWNRCRLVVENSLRLGKIEIAGGDKQEHAAIMRTSMMALAAPV
jgi:2-polyprenyl-6-methoxyphenol hydroxylase-like FAD-dependent oxidoreductase